MPSEDNQFHFTIPIASGDHAMAARITDEGIVIDDFALIPWEWIDKGRQILLPADESTQAAIGALLSGMEPTAVRQFITAGRVATDQNGVLIGNKEADAGVVPRFTWNTDPAWITPQEKEG